MPLVTASHASRFKRFSPTADQFLRHAVPARPAVSYVEVDVLSARALPGAGPGHCPHISVATDRNSIVSDMSTAEVNGLLEQQQQQQQRYVTMTSGADQRRVTPSYDVIDWSRSHVTLSADNNNNDGDKQLEVIRYLPIKLHVP